MNAKRALRWAGPAVLGSLLATAAGVGMIGAGVVVGLRAGYYALLGNASYAAVASTAAPGVVLAVVGLLVWWLGTAWAVYYTLTAAIEAEMGDRFDSEVVKSEILSVLDERLADMQMDLQSVNRSVRETGEDTGGFEFEG